jgi:outer membrane immunogenic protein
MRTPATTALALLMLGGNAAAADLTRPQFRPVSVPSMIQNWSGFYLGLNAGGGIGQGHSELSAAGAPVATFETSLTGAVYGGQVGFNWQLGPVVLGAEADFQGSGLEGTLSTPCVPGACATYSQKVPWFGTARGRIGYAAAGWLLYATGGYAYARVETDALATAGPVSATFTLRESRQGWTAGTGIEVEFAPRWSAKLEYLYLDLGRTTWSWVFPNPLLGPPLAVNDEAHLTMSVVRGGVNWRF